MLGLPSTTEVERRLPKEAFYKNLKLDAKTRDEFVHLIDRITIANSIKPSTSNFEDGKNVHEILFLEIQLKGSEQPRKAIETIASANPHKLVFYTQPEGIAYVLRKNLQISENIEAIALAGKTLDNVWDSICSQVVFGDADGTDIDTRIAVAKRRNELETEIMKLDEACRKAKQINKKNELFAKLKSKKRELEELY